MTALSISSVQPRSDFAVSEELVQFSVGTPALPLYGVLHHPAFKEEGGRMKGEIEPGSVSLRTGVVLLGGWSGTRVGPHGMLVSMARELAKAGFYALRFDFRGRGDSGGEQSAAHIGTMVEDAREAAAFLRRKAGVDQVILLGICAGAQVAMGAAPGVNGLSGMILWSPPPFHPDLTDSSTLLLPHSSTPPPRSRSRRVTGLLKQYWGKLFDARTWAKLRHGQLQPRTILKVLTGKAARSSSGGKGAARSDGDWAGPKPDEREYEQALAGLKTPALYIFGSNDPEMEESTAYYTQLRKPYADNTRIHVVPGANHAFYSLAWKEEVIRESLRWLEEVEGRREM